MDPEILNRSKVFHLVPKDEQTTMSPQEIDTVPMPERQRSAQEEIAEILQLYFGRDSLAVALGCLEEVKMDLYQNSL